MVQNSETEEFGSTRSVVSLLTRAGPKFLVLLLRLVFIFGWFIGVGIVAGRGGTSPSFCLASVVWLAGARCPSSIASFRSTSGEIIAIKGHSNTGRGG